MQLAQIIKERRSVHLFEDRPVSLELVTELLDTAVWVPNHKLTQPWRFIVVHGDGRRKIAEYVRAQAANRERDPAKLEELQQRLSAKMLGVPMFVLLVMKEHPHPVVREEDYASASCLIHNLSLLGWEHGLGMVWETYGMIHEESYRDMFGVQPGEKIVGSLHIGYPAKVPAAQPRIPARERLTVFE